MRFIATGQSLERVESNSSMLELLCSKNGTEVIHHRLKRGAKWSLVPMDDWDELEFIYVISGRLECLSSDLQISLYPGDSLSAEPVQNHTIFTAVEETEFLYVVTTPIFHEYSDVTKQFVKLATSNDVETQEHCNRIKSLSLKVGEKLGFTPQYLHALHFGAFFHDIGKSKIPPEILHKPGKLTPVEWEIMKEHTVIGAKMLRETQLPHLIAASIVAEQHHERLDGSGYPYGLKGDEIHVNAAIVAVVDSFDAMTSQRVYQQARTVEDAVTEIGALRGSLYHPDVVDAFMHVIEGE